MAARKNPVNRQLGQDADNRFYDKYCRSPDQVWRKDLRNSLELMLLVFFQNFGK